jgi:hypothetical protein
VVCLLSGLSETEQKEQEIEQNGIGMDAKPTEGMDKPLPDIIQLECFHQDQGVTVNLNC